MTRRQLSLALVSIDEQVRSTRRMAWLLPVLLFIAVYGVAVDTQDAAPIAWLVRQFGGANASPTIE